MGMTSVQPPDRRVFLARATLVLLVVALFAGGPGILPCPYCDWDGRTGFMRISGLPSRALCDRCGGKGRVDAIERLTLLAGGRLSSPGLVIITSFEELPPGWPSFANDLASTLRESNGNIRILWPSPPTLTVSTSGVLFTLQLGAILVIAVFGRLWRCRPCAQLEAEVAAAPTCPSCRGTGAISSFRRWVSEAWRIRLRIPRKYPLIGVLLLGALLLAAQVPFRSCERCSEIRKENLEARDVIRDCPRCGSVGKIGLWNMLFLSDH
jgi:Zn finger protein HypA/HybF involved in hydrogenase expression